MFMLICWGTQTLKQIWDLKLFSDLFGKLPSTERKEYTFGIYHSVNLIIYLFNSFD